MKESFQDIRPMRRTKKPIPPHEVSLPKEPVQQKQTVRHVPHIQTHTPTPVFTREKPSSYTRPTQGAGWGKILASLIGILFLLGGGLYGLSFLFRGAVVTITPKSAAGAISLNLTANKDATQGISFELMTLSDTLTKQVTATHTDVETVKSSGLVILYNFQPVSQKLIANTRLADGNGTIFRLKDSVTIPAKTASGGEILPGQATVTLVADVGGSAGNIPLSDFTVVAFKGMPREKLVYGRGKTAFTGGLEGSVFYLTDDEYTSTTSDLAGQLSNKLHDAIVKQIPEGYVLLQDSLVFSPGQNVNPGPQSKADITLSYVGKMRGILVRQSDLDATYLQNIVTDQTVTPDQVTIKGEDGLNYHTTTNVTGDTVPDTITFSVSGNLTAVWNIDKNSIAKSLVKTKRGGFSALMQTFPAIKQAELVLRPFWINILPGDPQKIQVIVNNVSN